MIVRLNRERKINRIDYFVVASHIPQIYAKQFAKINLLFNVTIFKWLLILSLRDMLILLGLSDSLHAKNKNVHCPYQ